MDKGRAAIRVLAGAEQSRPGALPALYAAVGRRRHDEGREFDHTLTASSLAEVPLPAELVDAGSDPPSTRPSGQSRRRPVPGRYRVRLARDRVG